MKIKLVFFAFILYTSAIAQNLNLQTLKTLDGETYKNVKIVKITEDSISISHENGMATLFLVRKPLQLKKQEKPSTLIQVYHESETSKAKRLANEQMANQQKIEKQKELENKISQLTSEIKEIRDKRISDLYHKREIESISLPENPSKTQKLNFEENMKYIALEISNWEREIELKNQKVNELKTKLTEL